MPKKGYKKTEEHKRKISETLKGRPSPKKGIRLSKELREKMSKAHLGQISWNKGKKLSKTQKAKLNMMGLEKGRGWNKGKKTPKYIIEKLRKSHTGKIAEKASNWKGGISRAYKTGFNSIQYKKWRQAVFERDNYICRKCGAHCGDGKTIYLTAHHIKSFSKHPKLRFFISNGITLCELCHCKTDKYRTRFMNLEAQIV